MKRKTLFAALACALLAFSMLGCGTTDHLQSIQLSTSNTEESPGSTLTLYGIGGTVQLYTWANYSNGKQVLLHGNQVAYQISSTATGFAETGGPLGDPNADPPQTVQLLTPNGLLTAIPPFACTWVNTAHDRDHSRFCNRRLLYGYGYLSGDDHAARLSYGRF